MSVAFLVLTWVTALAALAAAVADFLRSQWILDNMSAYGLPGRWIVPLGVIKALGALGLLAGLVWPGLGVAAAIGLVAYFVCAVAVVVRARRFGDIPYPAAYLALAVAVLLTRAAV